MTSDKFQHERPLPEDPLTEMEMGLAQARNAAHTLKRDRFELLSAYLDGEVTAAERHQVQEWLATDPAVQQLHLRLLHLRQGFQSLSVPQVEQPTEQTVRRVFAKIDRRPMQRLVLTGGMVAAVAIAALSGLFSGSRWQVAESPQATPAIALQTTPEPQLDTASEPLMIALNRPIIEIPKASPSVPNKVMDMR